LAEAVGWIAEAKALQKVGEYPSPRGPVPTLESAARDFLIRARSGTTLNRSGRRFATNTIDNYERALRVHVQECVGNRTRLPLKETPVDLIDTRTMQAMVNQLAANASPSVARLAEASLSAVLRDLFAREIIDELPNRPVLPSPSAGRNQFLSIAEADRLLAAALADDETYERSLMGPLLAVLIATGCRISEAFALTWGPDGVDLEAKNPTIAISRSSTKTDAGARRVGIEREFTTILSAHRRSSGGQTGALVFTNRQGEPLVRGGVARSSLARIAKSAGMEGITFHTLRHSQGSWLSAAGENATDIAARLGHSDPAFTLRRYVHADPARLAGPPDALEALRRAERAPAGRHRPKR
jgi:integrase